jgi:glycosyltransferase involved in cell wall biosynthesis
MCNLLHVSANSYSEINKADHNYKIWNELAKGFDKYYLFARSTRNKFETLKDDNITLILIPKIVNPARVFILSSFLIFFYIKKLKITHILCQSAIFGGTASILAKKIFGIPVMIEIHGEEYFRLMDTQKKYLKPLSKFLIFIYKSANKVRSLNPFMTQRLYKFGIKDNVTEIFNRVNLELFNQIKTDYQIQNDSFNIVSVGRFVKEKNYENLIKYLSKLKFKYHLTLIGGGELKVDYINIIQDLKQNENVTLIDWIDQKDFISILINSDIYIQCSISEGMPRTIVEAMALQMPILSTSVGSIQGVLENEVNGLLVSTHEDEIIRAIHRLYNSESLRSALAHKARKDVVEKYEWNSIFDKYRREIISMKLSK